MELSWNSKILKVVLLSLDRHSDDSLVGQDDPEVHAALEEVHGDEVIAVVGQINAGWNSRLKQDDL